jgi:hypothetical protein
VYKLFALFLKVTLIDNPFELVFVIVKRLLQRITYSADSVIKIIIIIWIMYCY